MDLLLLAANFRSAIERAKNDGAKEIFFRKFPVGQCGNTCDLLAQYLIDNGVSNVMYVNGAYSCNDSNSENIWNHAWLEVNDLIIDITGDQFKNIDKSFKDNCPGPVYVGPMNDFYKLFDTASQNKIKHIGLEKYWTNYSDLRHWYEKILIYL